jgi:hypothetical protein
MRSAVSMKPYRLLITMLIFACGCEPPAGAFFGRLQQGLCIASQHRWGVMTKDLTQNSTDTT